MIVLQRCSLTISMTRAIARTVTEAVEMNDFTYVEILESRMLFPLDGAGSHLGELLL